MPPLPPCVAPKAPNTINQRVLKMLVAGQLTSKQVFFYTLQ